MSIEKQSPCKVNLLLNILGKRADGFHELETILHPVPVFDALRFDHCPSGIRLTCSEQFLPTDSRNLVHRAAAAFLEQSRINSGVQIHLDKNIPVSAGLGGGSGDAATTLLGLNELFDHPLAPEQVQGIAAALGSDVPFFLQSRPALATGRGENIRPLDFFRALKGAVLVLVHPGFGVPTAWAYQALARYPIAASGVPGRADKLVGLLQNAGLKEAGAAFYNSLETPVMRKYPLLALFREFLLENGADVASMSGSGSSVFALASGQAAAEELAGRVRARFGGTNWITVVPVPAGG